MSVDEAYSLIERAIDAGRAAHGYLVVGDVKGNCSDLLKLVLAKLYPDEPAQVQNLSHPDIATLSPEGKLRIISVDSMRYRIVEPMSTTAFSGGWKVGVIYGADRLNQQSANAFLKSLEEPTPKTIYFLLTDQPDSILPTIVSRSQRIDLQLPSGVLEGETYDEIKAMFAEKDATGLAAKLKEMKDEADDADVPLVRKSFYRTIMSFARSMMLGGKLERYRAFANIEAVEEAYRRSERSMNDEAIISYMLDRITFPKLS